MSKKNILAISDTQFPAQHIDALRFCKAVQKKYKCGSVIQMGDLVDGAAFSRYEKNPDVPSAFNEMENTKEVIREWAEAFPKMRVLLGNHDRRILSKIRGAGIPSNVFSDVEIMRKAYNFPKQWTWHKSIVEQTSNGEVLFIHGDETGCTQRAGGNISASGRSVVHGHRHTCFFLYYRSTKQALQFDMNVGCLIDDDHPYFLYNKGQLKRPILGVGVIIDGWPQLVPMQLKNKRWTGRL